MSLVAWIRGRRGQNGFGYASTAEEVTEGLDLDGEEDPHHRRQLWVSGPRVRGSSLRAALKFSARHALLKKRAMLVRRSGRRRWLSSASCPNPLRSGPA